MSHVKAVLFDLDDTLFDHAHGVAHAVQLLRQDHESLQTKRFEDILNVHRRLLETMHLDVLAGRLSLDRARMDRMRGLFTFCGAEISDELASASAVLHRERYQSVRRAMPGAVALLQELRRHGVKIGIVTNNLLEEQKDKLAACGLSGLVDALVTSEEFACTKPDPQIFGIALDLVGCTRAEAVMVGDSWEADIVGARNAGIRAVWFNRFGAAQPPGEPVEEISSLEPAELVARTLLK